jgi:hypothetical protein
VPVDSRHRGTSRMVPRRLTDAQRDRLRWLLDDPEQWVLRTGWHRFLIEGDRSALVRVDQLTADQRVAALAWLRQQRHALHLTLEGEPIAPAGWLEGFGLYRRLAGGSQDPSGS